MNVTYGGNKINTKGHIRLDAIVRGNLYKIKFLVVDISAIPILGLIARETLNSIKQVENSVKEISEGIWTGIEVDNIHCNEKGKFIKENIDVFERIKQKLKVSLDSSVEKGILEQVKNPTESGWII